jgi:hypothetical protein
LPEITWVLVMSGAALLMGGLPLARLAFKIQIDSLRFGEAVRKLLDSDNLARAIKLCAAAPAAPLARGTRGMLQAFESGTTDSVALREAFERAAGGLSRVIFRWTWLSWLGLVVLAGAAALAIPRGFALHPLEIGPGLFALVICQVGIIRAFKLRARAEEAREAMLQHLQDLALRH